MARSSFSFLFVLAAAAVILFGVGAPPVGAQPVSATAPQTTTTPREYPEVKKGLEYLGKTPPDVKACLQAFKEAGRLYPELPTEHVMLFNFLARSNQPNAAKFQLEEAVKSSPSDPEPYVILGNLALNERRVAEAILDFEKAQTLLATYANAKRKEIIQTQALSGVAQVSEVHEDWKEAEARLKALLHVAPKDLLAHQRLARALFWQKDAGGAYTVLKDAKAIDQENAAKPGEKERMLPAEMIMARFYEEYEDPKTDNPKTWFEAGIKKAPEDLQCRLEYSNWALGRGSLGLVKEQAQAALEIEKADAARSPSGRRYSGSPVGRMLRGLVALWEKDWPEAEQYFEKIILESPNDFGARNNIALALVEQDDTAKKKRALDYAEANYRDNRENNRAVEALSTLTWVYFRRNEFDQARMAFEATVKAAGGNLNSLDTITYAAHIFHHQGEDWNAKRLLDGIVNSKRPFAMRPEAEKLYKLVQDAKDPRASTPTPSGLSPISPSK
jgi:tetratricopeptide (TPR) repeat protein